MNEETSKLLNEFGLEGGTSNIPLPGIEPSNVRVGPSNRPAQIQGVPARAGRASYKDALMGDTGEGVVVSPSTPISKNVDSPLIEIVATMLASGRTKREIAETTGKTYGTIARIAAQPVTKNRVQTLLRSAGQDGIKSFLASEVMGSLDTLVEIRDNPQARSTDRLSAANALLDRALGKPTQHIETKKVDDLNDVTLEASDLDRRIAETQAKLRANGVMPN